VVAVNISMRLGSIVLGVTFVFSLLAAAWSDAPGFITFVTANRAFFMGCGAGIMASGFVAKPLVLIAIVAAVFVVLRLLGV